MAVCIFICTVTWSGTGCPGSSRKVYNSSENDSPDDEFTMTHNSFDYKAYLRARGHRVTPQRELILDAICAANGHTTLDEIFNRARVKDPDLNLATLYRTLEFLRETQLVVEAVIKGQTVYEVAGITPHHHLICQKCGGVESLRHDLTAGFFAQVREVTGFDVEVNHLALFGTCRACQKKETGQGPNLP